MRLVVSIFLIFIVCSLASAFYFVLTEKGGSKRALKALTLRVGLSVSLFLILMLGLHFGFLPNNHL
jgi:Protein of unknown function (DUF2909)